MTDTPSLAQRAYQTEARTCTLITTDDPNRPEKEAILAELQLLLGDDWLRGLVHDFTGLDTDEHDPYFLRWVLCGTSSKVLLEVAGVMTFGFQKGGKFACCQRTGPTTARHIISDGPNHSYYRDFGLNDAEIAEWDESLRFARRTLRKAAR